MMTKHVGSKDGTFSHFDSAQVLMKNGADACLQEFVFLAWAREVLVIRGTLPGRPHDMAVS